MTTYYLDPEGGNDANDGTSYANRKKTLLSFSAAILVAADTIRVMASRDPYSLGNATFTDNDGKITLAGAKTLTVSNGLAADWAPNTNVTESTYTLACGTGTITCASYAIASGFTTGKIAHHNLGATLDLSAYTCISFLVCSSSALTSNVSLNLCSDTAGDVVVLSIPLQFTLITGTTRFIQMFFDNGGALPSGINSVSLRTATDPGTVTTLRVANIIACQARGHADHLSHGCLIGKGGSEPWYPLLTIDGVNLITNHSTFFTSVSAWPYRGTTETVTAYALDPTRPIPPTSANWVLQDSTVTISGGWNRTDMSTQTGATWMSGSNAQATLLDLNAKFSVTMEKMGFCHGNGSSGVFVAFGTVTATAKHDLQLEGFVGGGPCFSGQGVAAHFDLDVRMVNTIVGEALNTTFLSKLVAQLTYVCPIVQNVGTSAAIDFGTGLKPDHRLEIGTIRHCDIAVQAATDGAFGRLSGVVFDGNTAHLNVSFAHEVVLDNCSGLGTYPDMNLGSVGGTGDGHSRLRLTNYEGDPLQNQSQAGMYRFRTEENIGYPSAATPAWSFVNMNNAGTRLILAQTRQAKEVIGRFYCEAGVPTTLTAQVKRGDTDIFIGICVHGGILPGVDYTEDVITAAVDTWEELSITFTPTIAGVIDLHAFYYNTTGDTNYAYIDNVAQA